MKTFLFPLIVLLFSVNTADSQTPEEVAVQFLTDSIIGAEIYKFELAEKDTSKIHLIPILHKDYYNHGLLTNYQLVSEGISYDKSKSPFHSEIEWYIEGGNGQEYINKVKRTNTAYYNQLSDEIMLDTINIVLPSKIENIGIKNPYSIINKNRIFMHVHRALDTGEEYFVQIDFFRDYINPFNMEDGFIIDIEIGKDLKAISWDIGGAY